MLKSFDGRVFYREWTCVSPKAVIIFVHGMGGYSGRFFEMGPYFAKAGFQIFAIEQKGHGESPSIKGHISNFKLYSSDLKSLVEHARAQFPGRKIFVFGESMGGLITLDFCIHFQDLIDGIILVSPAVKDKLPMSLKKKAEILKPDFQAYSGTLHGRGNRHLIPWAFFAIPDIRPWLLFQPNITATGNGGMQ